jgi:hypothetical protein
MIATIFFAPGGWLIDKFNLSDDPTTAKYGTPILTVLLSIFLLACMTVAPDQLLAKLG